MSDLSASFTHKSRSSPISLDIPASVDYSIATGAILATFGGGLTPVSNVEEWIASTNQRPGKTRKSNKCLHRRLTTQYIYGGPITINRATRVAPTIRTVYTNYIPYSTSGLSTAVSAGKLALGGNFGFDFLANNGQSLTDQNFDKLRPDLTELSVPNFLLDWRQIASLWDLWNARKSLLVNVANKNLQLQYGWRPTIGDVAGMVGSIFALHTKLEEWRRNLGKAIRRRVTVLRTHDAKNASQAFLSWGTLDWSAGFDRHVQAFIQYRPMPLPELTNLERVIRGYMDILGFELNPAIIWDKIPFSFVVDWFIGIGSYLERLKLDTLELPFRLEDFYLQNKERLFVDSRVRENPTDATPGAIYPGATKEEVYFHRWQFAPSLNIFTNLGWKMPSRNQAGLALSLLISGAWK